MSKSIDEEIAELFGRPPEPVLDLTEKKPGAASTDIAPDAPPSRPEGSDEPKSGSATPASRAQDDLATAEDSPPIAATGPRLEEHASRPDMDHVEDEGLGTGLGEEPGPIGGSDETVAPEESHVSFEQGIARVRQATGRDDIAGAALSCLAPILDRAAILKVSSTEVAGWMSVGLTPGDAIDGLRLPLQTNSTLAMVAERQTSFVGALDAVPGDGVVCSLLSPPPSQALLVPVTVAGRVVCAVYGDLHRSKRDPRDLLEPVEAVAAAMGEGFEALIRQRKVG